MGRSLKTTTVLVASLSLIIPGPMTAQESAAGSALICPDGTALPCAEGVEPVPAPAEAAPAEATAAEAPAPEAPAAEAAPAGAPVVEQPAAEAAPAEAPVVEQPAAEAAPAGAPVVEQPAAEAPPVDAPVIEQPAADVAPAQAAVETPVVPEAAPTAEAAPAAEVTAEPAPETTEVPLLPVQPAAASGEAPVAAAAEAAAVDGTAAPAGVAVTEETVTEDSARSSSEDFANPVAPSAQKKKKSGLSGTEKAILLGLGAVAVGAILSNNRRVDLNSGDRVVVTRDDGRQQIIKDDDVLLRQPGSRLRTETFDDGSTRSTITRGDGTRIVTIRDAEYRVLRRVHIDRDGYETVLIDDTVAAEPVDLRRLPPPAYIPPAGSDSDAAALRAALAREGVPDRRFSLAQIRDIAEVRALVPVIDLDTITFETGSAAISPDQARALAGLGGVIRDRILADPREVFLIEGHTDAVGSSAYNLALSDRRAESVALALSEYFEVPPENLVVQGYGEEFLKIPTLGDERANRRASVRRITDLLRTAGN